jgi:hypothetical protein
MHSTVDPTYLAEAASRRQIVAAGGICPCGAHVKSWPWADRVAGIPEPWPRVVHHDDFCPANLRR